MPATPLCIHKKLFNSNIIYHKYYILPIEKYVPIMISPISYDTFAKNLIMSCIFSEELEYTTLSNIIKMRWLMC